MSRFGENFLCRRNVALLISGALAVAYSTSIPATFLFDDSSSIVLNTQIHSFWPLWKFHYGECTPLRWLVGFTLAINYAISGYAAWSYHLFNLAIHIVATIALYGIIRRTLCLPDFSKRYNERAGPLAIVIALLWGLHPLQTESVTYTIQRAESMMGMFFLLSLYCVIRGTEEESRQRWWFAGAALACLSSALCKQVALCIPLMVLLYDRTFLAKSFAEALRRRWPVHLPLFASWLLLIPAVHVAFTASSAGFSHGHGKPWDYALTQCQVIPYYLKQTIIPYPLCIDWNWPALNTLREAWPWAVLLLSLLLVSLYAVIRRPALGYPAAWFFIILGPTSSFMPIADRAVEHRMYLSLAGVLTLLVLGVDQFLIYLRTRTTVFVSRESMQKLPLYVAASAMILFGIVTLIRNLDYRSRVAMWADTVNKRPENQRAQYNLANALYDADRYELAYEHFVHAIRLKPYDADSLVGMGLVLAAMGRPSESISFYERAIVQEPARKNVRRYLGNALILCERSSDAIEHLELAMADNDEDDEAKSLLNFARGVRAKKKDKADEAIVYFRESIRLKQDFPEPRVQLAWILATHSSQQLRNGSEALSLAQRAHELYGKDKPASLDALAAAYAESGQFTEAIEFARRAMQLAKDSGGEPLAQAIQARVTLYSEKQPYREVPVPPQQ
jgi:protein O-mannosyl-transferase